MTDFFWSFSMVQDFFVWRFKISDSRRTALRGKLQNLQKFGIPSDVNTGRGRPAKYGIRQMIELSIAMDLMDLGFPPDSVVTILRSEMALVMEALNVEGEVPSYYGRDAPRPALMVISARARSQSFLQRRKELAEGLVTDTFPEVRRRVVRIMTPKELAEGLVADNLPLECPITIIDLNETIFRLKDWSYLYHPDGKRMRELLEKIAPEFLDSLTGQSK